MGKKVKLFAIGAVVFCVVLGVFILIFVIISPMPSSDLENMRIVGLEPYFVTQFWKENPEYEPPVNPQVNPVEKFKETFRQTDSGKKVVMPSPKVRIGVSKRGFSQNEVLANGSISLILLNNSDDLLSFIVSSPAIDGSDYSIAQFVISPKEKIALNLLIEPYIGDVFEKGRMPAEQSEKGVLVFRIFCISNCDENNSDLVIYANMG